MDVRSTLEQTINADAASRLTGIASMTNNHSARLRWMVTKSSRAAFVGALFDMAGIAITEDTAAELRPARIKRDRSDKEKVIGQTKESLNHFDRSIHQSQTLFNIQTGKAASIEVKTCLLSIRHTGEERHKAFVRECLDNPTCFEEPIKRVKLLTFKQECYSNRRSTNRKIAELKCSRNLMGRLMVLATRRHIDLELN